MQGGGPKQLRIQNPSLLRIESVRVSVEYAHGEEDGARTHRVDEVVQDVQEPVDDEYARVRIQPTAHGNKPELRLYKDNKRQTDRQTVSE